MSRILLEIDAHVATLTLSRPEALNALDQPLLHEFEQAIREVNTSSATVLVTRGMGKSYSAGSDLKELADCSASEAARLEGEHARVFEMLDDLPQLTIAAWRGHVLGGGLFLGVYHDFRIASQAVQIRLPEVPLGWPPPWGNSRLVELVGYPAAKRLLFIDDNLDGADAQNIGLVDQCWPDDEFDQQSEFWIECLANRSPAALTETKALLLEMRSLDHRHWDRRACDAFARCYDTAEARVSVSRFVRKQE